jgi:hypothetical protein
MGGNQSMRDAATLLPVLINMAETAKSRQLHRGDLDAACKQYEDEMMPRAFGWVEKSGSTQLFVSIPLIVI